MAGCAPTRDNPLRCNNHLITEYETAILVLVMVDEAVELGGGNSLH
jgi:hypothetical protein